MNKKVSKNICFITTNDTAPWGGSEVLWTRLAKKFSESGHNVAFSIKKWPKLPNQFLELLKSTQIFERQFNVSPVQRLSFKLNPSPGLNIFEKQFLKPIINFKPDLIIISQGMNFDGLRWMELCHKEKIPFVTISQAAADTFWPRGDLADLMHTIFDKAELNLFVSKDNLRLTEMQAGVKLKNACVINNPFNVPYNNNLEFPPLFEGNYLLACVGRLELEAKGQDVIFETLNDSKWRNRNLKIHLFGEGVNKVILNRLKKMFELKSVEIKGYADTLSIWKSHHGLILPSRHEGLPLALVEAMLCARFGIVTNVSGNTEVLENEINGFVSEAPKAVYLDQALEKAWQRREEWELIGKKAQLHIKSIVPENPVLQVANLIESIL